MSNYKLTFKLKQHTPIIHFQHDQHGATLRASELKPKLDRFLIENSFDGIFNFDSYKKFLIGDTKGIEKELDKIDGDANVRDKASAKIEFLKRQKLAFDYKVKLESEHFSKEIDLQEMGRDGTPKTRFNRTKEINEPVIKTFPLFFATMGEDWKENRKEFCFNSILQLTIFSAEGELLQKIKEIFALFIFLTNFGTRQNKGFGSYYIDVKDENYISPAGLIKSSKKKFWMLGFSIENERNINVVNSYDEYQKYFKVFSKIDDFYKAIRGGINLSFLNPPFYLKSLLYVYVTTVNKNTWEKKEIKDFHFSSFTTAHSHLHSSGNPDIYLYRDMLGLSNLQEWKVPYNDTITKEDLRKDRNDNPISGDKIERYKSPITFIPIQTSDSNFIVYVYVNGTNEIMLNRKFEIKSNNLSGQEIPTPISFDVANYLDFLEKIDLKKIVDPLMQPHWYFRKLTLLFSSFNKIK